MLFCTFATGIEDPWDIDEMGDVGNIPSDSDYSRFHNLNTLAAEICAFSGEARITKIQE